MMARGWTMGNNEHDPVFELIAALRRELELTRAKLDETQALVLESIGGLRIDIALVGQRIEVLERFRDRADAERMDDRRSRRNLVVGFVLAVIAAAVGFVQWILSRIPVWVWGLLHLRRNGPT